MSPFWMLLALKDNGDSDDNWSYKTCKAPVKLSPSINQHLLFTGRMAFLSPSCVKALKGISITLHRLDDCKLTWDLPTLSLTIKGSWLPWRKGCQTLISPGMQSFFHQLLNWADQNDMVVNLTKTKEMVFGSPSITSNYLPFPPALIKFKEPARRTH